MSEFYFSVMTASQQNEICNCTEKKLRFFTRFANSTEWKRIYRPWTLCAWVGALFLAHNKKVLCLRGLVLIFCPKYMCYITTMEGIQLSRVKMGQKAQRLLFMTATAVSIIFLKRSCARRLYVAQRSLPLAHFTHHRTHAEFTN